MRKTKISTIAIIVIVNVMFMFSSAFISYANVSYWIKPKAEVVGSFVVAVEIESNIPGNVLFSVSLELEGLSPYETFIGTSFRRASIQNGKGSIKIDGNKFSMPYKSKLPDGRYYVVVNFYPNWSENREAAKLAGISDMVEGRLAILLSGSGTSASSAKDQSNNRLWIMENVYMGMPWKPGFWADKFGSWKDVGYKGAGNPDILKMYYFKSADTTLLVNVLKKEIVTYRLGLAHE